MKIIISKQTGKALIRAMQFVFAVVVHGGQQKMDDNLKLMGISHKQVRDLVELSEKINKELNNNKNERDN